MPASFAAASTSGESLPSGAGTTITSRGTPGDLGRHGIHQHRGRIGGGAAGHVEADRFDRGPARPELDPERVGEAVVFRQLPAVIGLDPVAREGKGVERAAVAAGMGAARSRRRSPADRPGRDRSRSNFRVSSISAWSPRAATSAMIARTAFSTSAEASRLVASRARKRWAKSGARLSRRIGMACLTGPHGPGHRPMARASVRFRRRACCLERQSARGCQPGRRWRPGALDARPPARMARDRQAPPPGTRPRA